MNLTQKPLYQTSEIRLLEQMAVQELAVSEDELMLRAGSASFSVLTRLYPQVRNVAVFCGSGNNAGDGYVLARLAHEQGYQVTVYQYKSIEQLPPAACHAALKAVAAGVICQYLDDPIDPETELIVDALLGIGLKGDIYGPLATAINQINEADLPVLAIDIPSGLDADTGRVRGLAVHAQTTITFIGYKIGLMTGDGPEYCGEVICEYLQLEKCNQSISPVAFLIEPDHKKTILPKRPKNSHKGMFGHVLIIGGNYGMPGSVALAAQAAFRVGAGVVTIATRAAHADYALPLLAEAMIYGIEDPSELKPLLARATICILGPGLGDDDWADALYTKAMASQIPMVIDASALRLLAKNPQQDDNWILTPHPGEAAALLNCTAQEIQNDRYQSIRQLQAQYGGQIILKGSGSLIATDEGKVYLCSGGNPGMASAGMGDALSGVIAGLVAQGLILADAARLGVWLHAKAGDLASADFGERGLLASDLFPYLQQLINN